MNISLIQVSDEGKGVAYELGYSIGYFVGSHFYETLAGAVLVAAVIIYFLVFRKNKEMDLE